MLNIVVLTGAGVSAESGIATFRAEDGLWEQHRVEDVATPEGYHRDPKLVLRFYNERRHQLLQPSIQPNAAHKALAKLAQHPDVKLTLVTQNIDDLHERGGSHAVIHMHGELLKARCPVSEVAVECCDDLSENSLCRCCAMPSPLRPHIVWFGEMPLQMTEISDALNEADCFMAIGTSGNVYPAAGFVQEANRVGARTIELNLEASHLDHLFSEGYYGPASETVPRCVEQIINELEQ